MSINLKHEKPKTIRKVHYSSLTGKSRMDSLVDRIQLADYSINTVIDKKKQTKTNNNKNLQNNNLPNKNIIQDQKIENNENNEKTEQNEQKIINNNENNSDQNNNINNNQINIPFLAKTESLLNEIKRLSSSTGFKDEDLTNEVSQLPKRALLEISLNELKTKKKYETLQKKYDNQTNYVKKLENELVNQRKIMNELKKRDSENLVKISALEDELRVMKSKLLGYNENYNCNCNKKLNIDLNECGHKYGENLVRSYWVKDKFNTPFKIKDNNNNNFRGNWVSQSQGHFKKFSVFKSDGDNFFGNSRLKTINNDFNNYNRNFGNENGRYENDINNNYNNGANYSRFPIGNNFRRIPGMALDETNGKNKNQAINNEYNYIYNNNYNGI